VNQVENEAITESDHGVPLPSALQSVYDMDSPLGPTDPRPAIEQAGGRFVAGWFTQGS
jgi:hypothetical protein